MYGRNRKNNAQRARDDKRFYDSGSTTSTDSKGHPTTYYSDGSSSVYFGMCGTVEYDENGEEC